MSDVKLGPARDDLNHVPNTLQSYHNQSPEWFFVMESDCNQMKLGIEQIIMPFQFLIIITSVSITLLCILPMYHVCYYGR